MMRFIDAKVLDLLLGFAVSYCMECFSVIDLIWTAGHKFKNH